MGGLRLAHPARSSADRERSAPLARSALDLLPIGPGARRRAGVRQHLRRHSRRDPRLQPAHRLGLHQQPGRCHRYLQGAGGAGRDLAQRLVHALSRKPRMADSDSANLPRQCRRKRRDDSRRRRHSGGDAGHAEARRRAHHLLRCSDRRGVQRAVHRLRADAGSRGFPAHQPRTQPGRFQGGAAVLRLRLAELRLRRRRGQHRVLHDRRSSGARGPAGVHRQRRAAVVRAQRPGRKRMAAGAEPSAQPGDPARDPAVCRDAADHQSARRIVRERQQRSCRSDPRQ